ncbi:MAG: heparinase II/III family protein [Bacteroidales bacterium]|nr:heparinase II/III family protein [Candidatus Cryptobacteroides aphodequi]
MKQLIAILSATLLVCGTAFGAAIVPNRATAAEAGAERIPAGTAVRDAVAEVATSHHPELFWGGITPEEHFSIIRHSAAGSPLRAVDKAAMKMAADALDAKVLERSFDASGLRIAHVSEQAANRLVPCAYAFLKTGNRKYLDAIERDLRAVCSFIDWNAAGHSLDSSTMGVGVAIAYDWLYESLPQDLRQIVEKALYDFVLTPHLKAYDSGHYHNGYLSQPYLQAKNNWNQVCCASAIITAIVLKDIYPTECGKVIEDCVSANIKIVGDMYSPKGTYPEGPSYWGYGTSFQCLLCAAMETALGDNRVYDALEGFRNTGEYYLYTENLSTFQSFNYMDGGSWLMPASPMWYFAAKQDRPDLMYGEVIKFKKGLYKRIDFRTILMLVYSSPKLRELSLSAPQKLIYDGTDCKIPIVVRRSGWGKNDSFLGIKGGDAHATTHTHLDAGSFVFDALGMRWACDYGAASYPQMESVCKELTGGMTDFWLYDDGRFRWTINVLNNFTHNTLSTRGRLHLSHGKGKFTRVEADCVSIDISDALKSDPDIVCARREFRLLGKDGLEITDILEIGNNEDGSVDLEWRMLTRADVSLDAGAPTFSFGKKKMTLSTVSQTPVSYRMFDSGSLPFSGTQNYWDRNLQAEGYRIVGFESTGLTPGCYIFRTTLKP